MSEICDKINDLQWEVSEANAEFNWMNLNGEVILRNQLDTVRKEYVRV
jgi:hypothetical protein